MESLGLVFLGLIALSSLVQGLFLLGLGWGGLRLMRRIQELQGRVEDELKPALASVSRITRNVSEVSEIASARAGAARGGARRAHARQRRRDEGADA